MKETTATLSIDFNHAVGFRTIHTIITELNGPDVEEFTEKILKDPDVTSGENGTLRHGGYLSIAVGQRNMIRRLRSAGMSLDAIKLFKKPAADLLREYWPEEL